MLIKSFTRFVLVIGFMAFISSCNKTNNNVPSINGPVVILTPSQDSGYAAGQVQIDYTASATSGIKRIQIFTQFLSNPKVAVKDSSFSSTKPVIDYNYIYVIPDTAVRGQQSFITFTITDGNGNTTTKTATVTVTGSRPSITATPVTTTANAGDSLSYNVVMKSPDKNIQTLNVAQVIGGASTNLPSVPFSGNSKAESITYKYQVPTTSKSGDKIDLLFTAVNTSGVSNFTSVTITVN